MSRKLPNWLEAYLIYTNESESPEEYHKWSAISAIAGALRRKVFFDMGYFVVRPNNYAVLVGPAGRCKKSTAMRISRSLLSSVPGLSFTSDSTSRERLIIDLTQSYVDGHSSMTAYSSEFASLLSTSAMDMVVFLTDIYESPDEWEHRTKTGGTNKIKAPCLNMLGATTPDWIAKALPLDTIGIGLTSRIVFVYQDTPRERPPFPQLSLEQQMLRSLLIHDLQKMAMLSGQYVMTPDAHDYYIAWYPTRRSNPVSSDPRLAGYYERKHIHLIKIGMVVAASFRDELTITLDDLKLALGLLEEVEVRMPKVFANVGKNPLAVDYTEIESVIMTRGGMKFAELMTQFRHSVRKEELQEILETLIMSNTITFKNNIYVPLDTRHD